MSIDLGRIGRFEADLSHPLLFKRCATCPPEPPPCPSCAADEVCSLIGGGCDNCPVTRCEKIGGGASDSQKSSPAGPIAGGVIGGIVVICIMTFLVWRLCIKKRREEYDDQIWRASDYEKGNEENDYQSQKGRASMHSVRSIASTVLTRASNVIQIAYIPGVTNRSIESTPDLIPPVPPVPALSAIGSTNGTPHLGQDEHFFLPSDLRNSTYSDYTVDRTSFAPTSMSPSVARGSVPSTAYRGSAIVNTVPAQTAIRGKANPVAVKMTGKNSPSDRSRAGTPPVPNVERAKQETIRSNTTSPIVARLGIPKAVTVKKSNLNLAGAPASQTAPSPVPSENSRANAQSVKDRTVSVADSRHDGQSSTFDDASSSDEESPADQSLMGHDKLPRFSRPDRLDSPSSAPDLRLVPPPLYSPSPDSAAQAKKQKQKRSGSLNQTTEEAARKARKELKRGGLGSVGNISDNPERQRRSPDGGPFSDEHAARTP